MEERRPPEVTVHDPSRPARAADLLVSGEDEVRPSPFTKRRLQVMAALLLAGAVTVGVAELRERRAAAAEERRLDQVLDLAVEPQGGSSSFDPGSLVADLELSFSLHNDGPRDVVVERGTAGGYVLVQDLVEVPAGGQAPLLLRKTVTCSRTSPPPAAPVDALRLELRTAAGARRLDLPLDPQQLAADPARACGFVPLEEALEVQLLGLARAGEGLELSLDLSNRSVEPVSLEALDAGPGLRAQVTATDAGSPDLPLALPRDLRDGTRRGASLEVRVTVTDCGAARTTAPQLELQVSDETGRVSATALGYDPAFLGTLLSSACPS